MLDLVKERPLVFFDLETTGTNIFNDRIVEISIVKVFPNGEREVKTRRLNPECISRKNPPKSMAFTMKM